MKLKLEEKDAVQVLSAFEEISKAHWAILRAGLQKILLEKSKRVLLDLTQARFPQEDGEKEVQSLKTLVQAAAGDLVILSVHEKLNEAPSRDEGIKKVLELSLGGGDTKLLAQLQALQNEKAQLEKKITELAASGELRNLKKENTDLKASIHQLENRLTRLQTERTGDPIKDPDAQKKWDGLLQNLKPALQKLEVLKEGGA